MLATFPGRGSAKTSNMFQYTITLSSGMIQEPLKIFKMQRQGSDIPLPDPYMYIDKVDHRCKVDPELVADLDKVRLPFDSDYNSAPATGSANAGADNKCTQNSSGNWDIYVEKTAEVNKWDWEANLGSNAIWGGKDESSSKWGNVNSGWGAPLEKSSWRGWSNNQYASNNRNNNLYGVSSNNRYRDEDPSHTSGRKRNRGGHFQQRNNKQRSQDEGYRRSWQDDRGINREWRPLHNRAWQNGRGIEGGS